jgi:putative redox protein
VEILAQRKEAVPASFESIHLLFQIGQNDVLVSVEKAIQLSMDKYCSVAASLDKGIKLTWQLGQIEG